MAGCRAPLAARTPTPMSRALPFKRLQVWRPKALDAPPTGRQQVERLSKYEDSTANAKACHSKPWHDAAQDLAVKIP